MSASITNTFFPKSQSTFARNKLFEVLPSDGIELVIEIDLIGLSGLKYL